MGDMGGMMGGMGAGAGAGAAGGGDDSGKKKKKKHKKKHRDREGGGGGGDKDLTFEEKRQLGKDINKLQPEQVQKVVDILYENGAPQGEDGEIEIDIDAVDTRTLRRLQSYVKRALKPKGHKTAGNADNMLAQVENAAAATQKRKRELMEQQASLLEQDDAKRARHDDDDDSDSEEETAMYY